VTERWSIRFIVGSLKQLSSNIHVYDVALCHFQDAFHRFSSQYPHRDRCIASGCAYPSSAVFESCMRAKTVSDQHVWDIVARWHSLRPLQHLYLIPAIRSKYVDSFCPTRDTVPQEADPLDIAELAREEMYRSADSSGTCKTASLSPGDSGRFYKALTAYWLATESLKLARNCRYDLQTTMNRTFGRVDAMWLQRNSIQEGLDVLEVFDFVYGFLCQHIPSMRIDNFTDWVHEDWLSVLDPLHSEWAFFLKNMWLTLSPPDVLELLWSASSPTDRAGTTVQRWSKKRKEEYLRLRGFSYNHTPVVLYDVRETPDTWYSAWQLEEACDIQLQQVASPTSQVSLAWGKYRRTRWKEDVRGQFDQGPNAKLMDFIALEMQPTNGLPTSTRG
jgi:hypothetical protein